MIIYSQQIQCGKSCPMAWAAKRIDNQEDWTNKSRNRRLKIARLSPGSWRSTGRLFHAGGAEMAKVRCPIVDVCDLGPTDYMPAAVERRCVRPTNRADRCEVTDDVRRSGPMKTPSYTNILYTPTVCIYTWDISSTPTVLIQTSSTSSILRLHRKVIYRKFI